MISVRSYIKQSRSMATWDFTALGARRHKPVSAKAVTRLATPRSVGLALASRGGMSGLWAWPTTRTHIVRLIFSSLVTAQSGRLSFALHRKDSAVMSYRSFSYPQTALSSAAVSGWLLLLSSPLLLLSLPLLPLAPLLLSLLPLVALPHISAPTGCRRER